MDQMSVFRIERACIFMDPDRVNALDVQWAKRCRITLYETEPVKGSGFQDQSGVMRMGC